MAIYKLHEDHIANDIKLANALRKIAGDDSYSWEIMIPRDFSRIETSERVDENNVKNVPHYSIFITNQIGSPRNRRDTLLYCKFPNSDKIYTVRMYMDGGVDYERHEHKFILRDTDELDRRIVLGFCKMYQYSLVNYCYNHPQPDPWIMYQACTYTSKKMAKRIKRGSQGNNFNYRNLNPYEESSMFSNAVII